MDSSRRLLHRWFVEYNPLYLLSALFVLGGTIAIARGLASEGSRYGALAVAAIVEVYAIALVGGAALLYRLGHRRSAVMLAFLAALYQGDLMLHTETCPNLGGLGALAELAAVGWLALFVAKLVALARALRLRMNAAARVTFAFGGAGLAAIPWVLHAVDERTREAVVMLWLFTVTMGNRYAVVSSTVELDPWGAVVLRRSLRVLDVVWATLLLLHVGFWMTQSPLALAPLMALVPLAFVGRITQPGRVALVVVATLGFVALRLPEHLSVTAAIAAVALALRARESFRPVASEAVPATGPYRNETAPSAVTRVEADPVAIGRLAVFAAACAWLALWTIAWKGGALPAHSLPLDLVFSGLAVVPVVRRRWGVPVAMVTVGWVHRVVTTTTVPLPGSAVGWGALAVSVGFVLLLGSLVASYLLRVRGSVTTNGKGRG